MALYSYIILSLLWCVQKSGIYVMVGIFLLLGATIGAFVCVEDFVDTVDIFWGKLANIRHFSVTLLAFEHLCKFGKLNAPCEIAYKKPCKAAWP